MKVLKREPIFEQIDKALLKAYAHIPAELEYERKLKQAIQEALNAKK